MRFNHDRHILSHHVRYIHCNVNSYPVQLVCLLRITLPPGPLGDNNRGLLMTLNMFSFLFSSFPFLFHLLQMSMSGWVAQKCIMSVPCWIICIYTAGI